MALQEEEFSMDLLGFEDEELARLLAAQDAAEGLTDACARDSNARQQNES